MDASGRSVAEPTAGPGRVVTTLVIGERRVALVSHAQGVPEIETAMGAAVRMALDNERLQAEGLAQLDDCELPAPESSRRAIWRDGGSSGISMTEPSSDSSPPPTTSDSPVRAPTRPTTHTTGALLARGLQGTQAALDELRELAHGIYPAILGEAGLAAALATLADTTPLRLETRNVTEERYPTSVETSAYVLVVEAVDDAAARDATHVTVSATPHDGGLLLAVADDGFGP